MSYQDVIDLTKKFDRQSALILAKKIPLLMRRRIVRTSNRNSGINNIDDCFYWNTTLQGHRYCNYVNDAYIEYKGSQQNKKNFDKLEWINKSRRRQ